MESVRQKQVSELVRRTFSMILMQEGGYIYGREVLVTLTGVKMTPDLLTANMYISVWNTENKQEVLLMLEDSMPRLRSALSKHLGKQLRRMPYIAFFLDETVDEMYRVEEMMKKVEAEDEAIRSLPKS